MEGYGVIRPMELLQFNLPDPGTNHGRQIMAALLCLRDVAFPELFHKNIAD